MLDNGKSLYFYGLHELLPPEADEDAQYTIDEHPDGFTARLEGDGWTTIYPNIPRL